MEQMDAWGAANVIYQCLMQQELCRVHAAAWGICVTELQAKDLGNGQVSGTGAALAAGAGMGITVVRTAPSPEQAPAEGTEQPEGSLMLSQGSKHYHKGQRWGPILGVLLCFVL